MKYEEDHRARYTRHLSITQVGEEGQLLLSQSKVLVIGAGALGCPVLQYLTGAGVGTIGVVDRDRVELSNLHRQPLYCSSDVGYSKAERAGAFLKELNPHVQLHTFSRRFTHEWAELVEEYDLIVDATDNFESRYLINDACVHFHKPFISGSVYLFEGQLSVFNFQNGPTYRCLFPNEDSLGFGCSETGVLGPLPGAIGSMMGMEALKLLLHIGEVLSGKLLILNALTWEISILEFTRSEASIQKSIHQFKTILNEP